MADFSKSDPEELAHNFTLVHGAVLGNSDAPPSDPVPSPASAVFELPVVHSSHSVGLSVASCFYETTRSYNERCQESK